MPTIKNCTNNAAPLAQSAPNIITSQLAPLRPVVIFDCDMGNDCEIKRPLPAVTGRG